MQALVIRPIRQADNAAMAAIIKSVLADHGFGKGSAAEDPELDDLTGYFTNPAMNGAYFVVSDEAGRIVGGGGVARLTGTAPEERVGEIQKFYLLPEVRGLGVGKKLLQQLIQQASSLGYAVAYLETASRLQTAVQLFEKCGFEYCDKIGPIDRHSACELHMKKML